MRSSWDAFLMTWNWKPSVLIGCEILLFGYMLVLKFRLGKPALLYTAGVVLILLSLVSPLDTLGDIYLFSAHMIQHLLMVLAIPPLLIWGVPVHLWRRVLQVGWVSRTERILAKPYIAWTIGILGMSLWHLPGPYEAALQNQTLHIFQHLFFLVSAVIFWWPVITPVPERRFKGSTAVLYMIASGIASNVLGIVLTFAPAGFYPTYQSPADWYNLLPIIRDNWGISAAADMQLGGMMMWVVGSLVYATCILVVFGRWMEGHAHNEPAPRRKTVAVKAVVSTVSESVKTEPASLASRAIRTTEEV